MPRGRGARSPPKSEGGNERATNERGIKPVRGQILDINSQMRTKIGKGPMQ